MAEAQAQPTVAVKAIRRFHASPEDVFDAWIDSKKAGLFLFATPTGHMVNVEIDARPGGAFTIVERRDGLDVKHTGEYLEIDRPRRLIFTFSVPQYAKDITRVTIDISSLAEGQCELTLTHEGVWPDYVDRTRAGWVTILDKLASVLEGK